MRIIFLHLSTKLGGGNSQLNYWEHFLKSNNIICESVSIRNNFTRIFSLFFFNRNNLFVFSDPFVGLLLWVFCFKRDNVLRYSQGDDFNLYFRILSFPFNLIVSKLIFISYRFSNYKIISNSFFTNNILNKHGFDFNIPIIWPIVNVEKTEKPLICSIQSANNRKNFRLFNLIFDNFREDFSFLVISSSFFKVPNGMGFFVPNSRVNLSRILKSSFAHISTSDFDSFGLPIYEAMELGVPSIIFDNGCIKINEDCKDLLVLAQGDLVGLRKYLELLKDEKFKHNLISIQRSIVSKYINSSSNLASLSSFIQI
jgi:glycosyltransferase involved in cell wall biosynthesis